ncbi:histidinol-phosphate aminotransferase family protein [bacterium]|nr:histidinol-phosphate aminotransferase family protein [candidate division CSSED10-310 bacterium]
MIDRFIRSDLPGGAPFTVSQKPYRAKMDQNESPFDLPAGVKAAIMDELRDTAWNRYPQPAAYQEAKRRAALALGVAPEQLAITVGCDQAIQGAHWLAGGCGRSAVVFEPTYPMLYHAALLAGTSVTRVMAGPAYDIDPSSFDGHDLILIAAPNNPTGGLPSPKLIDNALGHNALVMIDEAYYDISGVTYTHLLADHPNLYIGRSCSKSLLAGMRLGFALGHPTLITALENLLTAPYHLSTMQLILASHYGSIRPHVEECTRCIRAERTRLATALKDLGIKVYPSAANFIMFEMDKPGAAFETLADRGIRLRNLTQLRGLERHLRVTVAAREENDLFLETLRELLD